MKAEIYEFGNKYGVQVDRVPIAIGIYVNAQGKEVDGGPLLFLDIDEAQNYAQDINSST